jgi:hypothetical protein
MSPRILCIVSAMLRELKVQGQGNEIVNHYLVGLLGSSGNVKDIYQRDQAEPSGVSFFSAWNRCFALSTMLSLCLCSCGFPSLTALPAPARYHYTLELLVDQLRKPRTYSDVVVLVAFAVLQNSLVWNDILRCATSSVRLQVWGVDNVGSSATLGHC